MASTDFTDNSTVIAASWLDDVDVATYSALSSVAGTNTVTATGPVPMSAYASGQMFRFIPANTNTGATTINITPSGGSALGAKNIFNSGAACTGGEIKASVPCLIVYDGTQFNIIGPSLGKDATKSAFLARGGAAANQTGDGTATDITGMTEVFDQSAAFNPTTGVFTAPGPGRFMFAGIVGLDQVAGTHTSMLLELVTTARTYNLDFATFGTNPFTSAIMRGSILADMAAGDTAKLRVTVSGGAKAVDILDSPYTQFSGFQAS